MRLSLIGAGKLGTQLFQKFAELEEIEVVQWMYRSTKPSFYASKVELVNQIETLKQVDCYLLAVPDQSIQPIASQLPTNSLVIHTSGATEIEALKSHSRRGVFYPIQTFSANRFIDFTNLPIGIEASHDQDLKFLTQLCASLHGLPVRMDSKQRKAIHLAAVLANNFTNYLFTQAALICQQSNLSFDLLKPLIVETVSKLNELTPRQAQTGPALRNDTNTIDNHLEIINDPKLKKVYFVLTNAIMNSHQDEEL